MSVSTRIPRLALARFRPPPRLLAAPPALAYALRPSNITTTTTSLYHSYDHPAPPPFPPTETAILSAAITHVSAYGFTEDALRQGAQDAGYRDASTNLFLRGPFELVNYHLVTRRLGLKGEVQFPQGKSEENGKGVGQKVRALVMARLRANVEAGVLGKWQEALALMAFPANVSTSLAELARLSDEIWFLAGDTSVDTSWYTKRASLAAVYSAAEVYMTQDQSTDFTDTRRFVDRRLEDLKTAGRATSDVAEWLGFTGHAVVNVLRSKGLRL